MSSACLLQLYIHRAKLIFLHQIFTSSGVSFSYFLLCLFLSRSLTNAKDVRVIVERWRNLDETFPNFNHTFTLLTSSFSSFLHFFFYFLAECFVCLLFYV